MLREAHCRRDPAASFRPETVRSPPRRWRPLQRGITGGAEAPLVPPLQRAAHGLHLVRQHKWQRVQLLIHPSGWSDLTRSVFYGTQKACTALAGLVTFVSGLAGIGAFLVAGRQLH
jgi:hypothetical protein